MAYVTFTTFPLSRNIILIRTITRTNTIARPKLLRNISVPRPDRPDLHISLTHHCQNYTVLHIEKPFPKTSLLYPTQLFQGQPTQFFSVLFHCNAFYISIPQHYTDLRSWNLIHILPRGITFDVVILQLYTSINLRLSNP